MKNRFDHFYIVVVCILTLSILGCGSDDEDAEPDNYSPTVESFVVPTEYDPGDVLEFSVVASDKDGDTLSYTWEVEAGKLSATTGTKVEWTAPEDDIESVRVTVYVDDGVSKTTKRVKRIANTEFILPEPPKEVIDNIPDPPLNLIVPGKGAFGISLEDPFKKVKEIHGDPDDRPGVNGLFTFWNPDLGFAGFIDNEDLVRFLFLDRPNKARTAGRNGIGTKVEMLEDELGKPDEIDNDNFGGLRYWFWKLGIEFTINENERVDSIAIFTPIDIGQDVEIRPEQPIREEAHKIKQLRATYSKHNEN
ncbi:MAG: hypothetical protein OXD54_09020 [Candidatus Poribacteria bacterium]|nr:hypothetical protein [Candidatus Poribacteria bacterium]